MRRASKAAYLFDTLRAVLVHVVVRYGVIRNKPCVGLYFTCTRLYAESDPPCRVSAPLGWHCDDYSIPTASILVVRGCRDCVPRILPVSVSPFLLFFPSTKELVLHSRYDKGVDYSRHESTIYIAVYTVNR